MGLPNNIKYTEDHELVKIDGDIATVGITNFAQSELGDIIFIEFPDNGLEVNQKEVNSILYHIFMPYSTFIPHSHFHFYISNITGHFHF